MKIAVKNMMAVMGLEDFVVNHVQYLLEINKEAKNQGYY